MNKNIEVILAVLILVFYTSCERTDEINVPLPPEKIKLNVIPDINGELGGYLLPDSENNVEIQFEKEEKSINNSKELTIKAVQVTKEIPSEKDKFPDDYEGPEAGTWLLSGVMDNSFNEINVSSTLTPQGKNSYEAINLSDDNPQTAWVEGKKDDYGINETLELIGGGIRITIYNGYQRDYNSFYNNSRVKTFKVYFDNEPIGLVELFDSPGAQLIDLEKLDPNNISPKIIKLEIIEVYEGKKWDGTAISEIFYVGG